jgi:hypothetical protein
MTEIDSLAKREKTGGGGGTEERGDCVVLTLAETVVFAPQGQEKARLSAYPYIERRHCYCVLLDLCNCTDISAIGLACQAAPSFERVP